MAPSALDQVEEAVNLLRRQPASSWMLYLLGAVPLSLAILTFVRDMRSGFGADQCLAESLLCALVFFWASFWKARFAAALLASLAEIEDYPERNRAWECAFLQSVLQAFKLCLLPFVVISVAPLPWFSALFRSINAEANQTGATLSNTLRKAAAQASADGKKNWVAMLLCSVAASILFANIFPALLLLPTLWKAFTGVETDWTRNARYVANGNTFAIAVAITWLGIDPLLQAYSAVRAFYFEARSDGRDLLIRLRHVTAGVLILLMISSAAECSGVAARNEGAITENDVNRGLAQVIGNGEYDWLRTSGTVQVNDWFGARVLRGINRGIKNTAHWISNTIENLFSRHAKPASYEEPAHPRAPKLKWLIYTLAALLAVSTVFLLIRTRSSAPRRVSSDVAPAAIDLKPENLLASERAEEEWLAMARNYVQRGELRLAVRAMYLSNLAYLGARQLIGISKSNSNAVYERELRLRCRAESVCHAFATANRQYERVWYGMHDATPELMYHFEQTVSGVRGND